MFHTWLAILLQIFNGIQRPLKIIADYFQSIFIQKVVDVPFLDLKKLWSFQPNEIKVGDILSEFDIFGFVNENSLLTEYSILVPPKCKGKVTEVKMIGDSGYPAYLATKLVQFYERNDKAICQCSHLPSQKSKEELILRLLV